MNLPNEILWLAPSNLKSKNSAAELAEEYFKCKKFKAKRISNGRFIISNLNFFARDKTIIYSQISNPLHNFLLLTYITFGIKIYVHYLDDIAAAYPRWAKYTGLGLLVMLVIRRCHVAIAISPAMKAHMCKKLKRKSRTIVFFRCSPNFGLPNCNHKQRNRNRVVFIGSINPKTNAKAILKAADLLNQNGFKLEIYARTIRGVAKSELENYGAIIHEECDPNDVVCLTSQYPAQLLPFNFDEQSKRFYRLSCPSKLPNMLAAQRKIIYFGPECFWLFKFLIKFEGLMHLLTPNEKLSDDYIYPVNDAVRETVSASFSNLRDL